MLRSFAILLTFFPGIAQAADPARDWISVGSQATFVTDSGDRFTPWGFNYDHDVPGRLLEDYWANEWPLVEADFREMKSLGANVVRIHLQFGRFMLSATEPNRESLARLHRLVELAEATGLYLDLTGLGCYHKQDVPGWYDALDEAARWQAQAAFWREVAGTCAKSPAIFCYDLMNEPVSPGGKSPQTDWLGPAFGDKHFVQRISLDSAGRPRPQIARQWIDMLVAAIREVDSRHLITVGLVDWSLDRPGLTSGFVPDQIVGSLDFLCVHIYPETGKVDEALATLRGFAIGKPVVIEETFLLKCPRDELRDFLSRSSEHATGWIGFYWGRTPDEYRQGTTFIDALMLQWFEVFQSGPPPPR